MVKLFYFQFDFILHVHPNTYKGVKYYPNSIYTQNKHSLKYNTFSTKQIPCDAPRWLIKLAPTPCPCA